MTDADRANALDWLNEIVTNPENWRMFYSDSETKTCAEAAIELLKEQKAKRGKWERQYSRPGVYANLYWWCSACEKPTRYNDAGIYYEYCPHCGAKMEAGEEG